MCSPKVSVIIPIYNPGNLLINCLDSIKNQSLEDIEVICVNDGSTDNSLDVLKNYEKEDNRFKIFNQINSGAGNARNNGIKYSSGEFILFVDSDDFIEKDTCEKLYYLAKKLNSDLILFDAVRHAESGKNLNIIHFSKNNRENFEIFTFDYEYVKDKVFDGYYGVIWNKFYKSSFLQKNKITFPNHKIYNDVEFHVKSLILAKKIAYVRAILYHYNRLGHSSLQTSFVHTNQAFVFFDVLNGIKQFLIDNDFFDEFKVDFIRFSIFELSNKLSYIDDEYKNQFFQKSKQIFHSFSNYGVDLNSLSFEYFMKYILIINSDDYNQFIEFSNIFK